MMLSRLRKNAYPNLSRILISQLLLLLLVTGSALAQPIRYVTPTGTGNGSSWANASGNLQAMIDASNNGDQVWVATGTYKPTTGTDRTISFSMKEGVAIYGGFAGNESTLSARPTINPVTGQPSNTTLSGDIGTQNNASDNSYHVIKNSAGLTAAAILDGFVITRGNADGDTYSGAAIYNDGSNGRVCSPLIRNCSLVNNSATASGAGGGLYNNGENGNCNPQLLNCLLQGNSATLGGAILHNGASATSTFKLTNCLLQGNSAAVGGAIVLNGPSGHNSIQLTNCTFQDNSASAAGGAIFNNNSTDEVFLTNCSFIHNTTNTGGAIYAKGTNCKLINCTFLKNSAYYGGAIYQEIYGNELVNCIFFDNGGAKTLGSYISASYCLFDESVTGYGSGPGNLTTSTSPFISENSIALKACSPAINAGDPATTSAVAGSTDLAGNPRFYSNGRIDMGAVEFQNNAGEIATQPVGGSAVCAGSNSTATISVSGVGPFTYQWFRDNQPTPVASQTAITLSLSNVTTTDAGSYSVGITGGCSSITASVYSLTVLEPPTGFAINSVTVCRGESATLFASGCPAGATVRWQDGSISDRFIKATTGSVSASCIVGNCAAVTANATVTVSTNAPAPPAAIAGLQASTGGCPYSISGQATGNGFVVSGPNGYVFGNVYRDGGASQAVWATGIKEPGTYTLTATYANSCGSNSVSRTVVISGNRCP